MTGRDVKLQLDVMERDGYIKARTILARLLEMNDADRLLLRTRIEAACSAEPKRVRSLWTAWCVTTGAVPGTPEYDRALRGVLEDFDHYVDPDYMAEQVNEFYGLKK